MSKITVGPVHLIENPADPQGSLTAPKGSVVADTVTPSTKQNIDGVTNYQEIAGIAETLFEVPFTTSGSSVLGESVTIVNAQFAGAVSPSLIIRGQDALAGPTWPTHVGGDALIEVGSGSSPSLAVGAPFLDGTDAVKGNVGKHFEATNPALGNLLDGYDGLWELIFKFETPIPPVEVLWHKFRQVGGSLGWLFITESSQITFQIIGTPVAEPLIPGAWYIVHAYLNRSEVGANLGLQLAVNGVFGSHNTANIPSITHSVPMGVFSTSDGGSYPTSSTIAWAAMWQQPDWYREGSAGRDDFFTWAAERAHKMTGLWPTVANGTYAPDLANRSSVASLNVTNDDGDRKVYWVGANWMRVDEDIAANDVVYAGYHGEANETYLLTWNRDLSHANWTKSNATISTDATEGVDDLLSADGVVANTSYATHYVEQGIVLPGVSATYMVTGMAKAGSKDWLYVEVPEVANATAYVDLAKGELGTVGAGFFDGDVVTDWINGWVFFWFHFIEAAGSNTARFAPAICDGVKDYFGDGAGVDVYLDFPTMMNRGQVQMSFASLVETQGSAVTRAVDQLRWLDSDNLPNNEGGTLDFEVLSPATARAFGLANTRRLMNLNDAASVEQVVQSVHFTKKYQAATASGGGNSGDVQATTNIIDDRLLHTLRTTWADNDVKVYVDGVEENSVAAGATPDNLEQIQLGINSPIPSGMRLRNVTIKNLPEVQPAPTPPTLPTRTLFEAPLDDSGPSKVRM